MSTRSTSKSTGTVTQPVQSVQKAAFKPARRVVHLAAKVRDDGAVSARCFMRERPIDMRSASWTLNLPAVTCPRCKFVVRRDEEIGAR